MKFSKFLVSYSRERNLIIFIHEKVDKEAMCMLVVISLLALAGAYGVLYLTAYVPVSFLGQYAYKFFYLYRPVMTVSPKSVI